MRNLLLLAAALWIGPAGRCLAEGRVGLVSIWIPKITAADCAGEHDAARCVDERQLAAFDRARDWYRDALGFEVVSDIPARFDGVAGRWIELRMPGQPGLKMVLKAGRPITDDTSFTITPDGVDDLCRRHARLQALGALDPRYPVPVRQPWALEFRVVDPFGQRIVISIPAAELQPNASACEARRPVLRESTSLGALRNLSAHGTWAGS